MTPPPLRAPSAIGKAVGDWIEGAGVRLACFLFSLLPLDAASGLGGWIGRTFGLRLPATRRAMASIARALPELSTEAHRRIIRAMWDNLGRSMAEYPHLRQIAATRVEVVGREHFERVQADGEAGFLVSGHIANWEVGFMMPRQLGVDVALVYRVPNNPYSARLLLRLRAGVTSRHLPKGSGGAREILKVIAEKGHVLMLLDQKMNNGIPVPFFGRDAMTAPAAATLALRHRVPFVPYRIERTGGANFRLTILPPLEHPSTGSRDGDVLALMSRFNDLLEGWIRERPEQWLWQHRRWPQ